MDIYFHIRSFYFPCPTLTLLLRRRIYLLLKICTLVLNNIFFQNLNLLKNCKIYLSKKCLRNIFIYCYILQFINPISTGWISLFLWQWWINKEPSQHPVKLPDQQDFLNKKSSFFIKISLKKVLIYFIQLIRKFLTRFKIIKWFLLHQNRKVNEKRHTHVWWVK